MTAWILSIVGVVFLSVMTDVISPEGKTNAFIKSIFAIIFMYVILTPVIKLFNEKNLMDITNFSIMYEDEFQEQKLSEIELEIETNLVSNGVYGVNIDVKGYSTEEYTKIQKVQVDLSNLVLNNEDKHINKYKLITKLIVDVVDIDEENIVYD